jgi:uncharacterized protein DUF6101
MGGVSARSGHAYRLDPRALVAQARLEGIGSQPFTIDLDRAAVVFGGDGAHAVPFATYRGISIRMEHVRGPARMCVWLEILHADAACTVPLTVAEDHDAVVADWQEWGRVLRLPLLVIAADGTVSTPLSTLGPLVVFAPKMRRRPAHFARRRPRFLVRRKMGGATHARVSGREIIAPD